MAPIKITVVDRERKEHKEIVSNDNELNKKLSRLGAGHLVDEEGFGVDGFESLVDGSKEYTLGPLPPQQHQQQHQNVAEGVFVLYRGDDENAEPIGTAFAISENLLLTACHNVVVVEAQGEPSVATELKVTTKLIKSAAGVISTDESQRGVPVHVHKYNTQVNWACLRRDEESSAPFPFVIPVATSDSDMPKPASTEKLFIYHCPVQQFLDDTEIEVCHVMVMEASVGLVGKKTINFQNGGFPGSCGGPYVFRNKAIALHVDSVSTTKTADNLKNETTTSARSGRKRKLTEAEITRMVADSCASSHTSLGTGIILHVRSGIMAVLQE